MRTYKVVIGTRHKLLGYATGPDGRDEWTNVEEAHTVCATRRQQAAHILESTDLRIIVVEVRAKHAQLAADLLVDTI